MKRERHQWSRSLYRRLLRAYPLEFRCHFRADMETDFAEMLLARGRVVAWSRVLRDWARSVSATRAHACDKRRRARAIAYRGETRMSSLLFDLRHVLRSLVTTPVFSLVVIVTLALGIGANSAIFSLVNSVLLRPLGYVAPERLMVIHEQIPESKVPRWGVSPADYIDMVQYQSSFERMGAYRTRRLEMSGTADPEEVVTAQMTPDVFSILGVAPAIGRVFRDDEEQGEFVAVISHGLWQRRFGGQDPLGSRLLLDRRPYTIIGVMPASFQFPRRGAEFNNLPADVWLPLVFNPFERRARGMFYSHGVIGRLRDGVSVDQAAADVAALAPRIRQNYPAALQNSPFSLVVIATPYIGELVGQVRTPLLILLGAVGLVLLVACANVANLMLSRSVVRQREISIRSALGAARHRLMQLMLLEGLVLSLLGGVLGLALGYWALRLTPAVLTTSLPGVMDVRLDARVLTFTFALSALTACLFSLAPLAAGALRDMLGVRHAALQDARTIGDRRQHRAQGALVMASVALAFVLLIGAGLLIRSFSALVSQETGLRADNVLSMRIMLPAAGYSQPQQLHAFYRNVHERLAANPGVRAVSVSTDLPIRGDGERRAFTPERAGEVGGLPPSIAVTWTFGDYFETFGIPIVRGRTFTSDEQAQNRGATMISAALAARFWPGEDPIGKRIKWGIAASTAPWYTIVGVAGDVVDGPLGTEPVLHAYVPFTEVPDAAIATPIAGLARSMTIAMRGDIDTAALVAPARQAIRSVDPALAVSDVISMDRVLAEASAPQRFSATVLSGFAAGALLLAAIGLYGVLSFSVGQRTREIGVRLALGADRSGVVALVLRQGMTLVASGLVLGLAGAIAASRLMTTLLYQTGPYDIATYLAVPLVLAGVSLLACYLPARRASTVEPSTALRIE
jgi:putative ABC transport system permease protein